MSLAWNLLYHMSFATLAAVGFGLLFNVPLHALKYCALCSAVGMAVRVISTELNISLEWASFFAATVVGFLGVHWAQRLLAHPKVFTVASIIPMMPGLYGFKAMISLVDIHNKGYSQALWAIFINDMLKASFIIGALTIGLALPGLLFYRGKSVV